MKNKPQNLAFGLYSEIRLSYERVPAINWGLLQFFLFCLCNHEDLSLIIDPIVSLQHLIDIPKWSSKLFKLK
jgi:hypothetical protein